MLFLCLFFVLIYYQHSTLLDKFEILKMTLHSNTDGSKCGCDKKLQGAINIKTILNE